MRDSLVLHTDHFEQIEVLSMEQRGVLLTAIMQYQTGGEVPEMDAVTKMCFGFIRMQLDRDNAKFEAKCQRNAENAKRRWDANACDRMPENANACDRMPDDANACERMPKDATAHGRIKSHSENENEYENEYEYENENENEYESRGKKGTLSLKKAAAPQTQEIEEAGFAPDLEQAVKDWLSYKAEKRQTYKPAGFHALLNKIKTEEARHGPAPIINAIHDAMANGWQGIAWDRIGGRSPNDKPDRIANRVMEVDEWNF